MNEDQLQALFLLASIRIIGVYELQNGYWPDVPEYAKERRESPWWLVNTSGGLVKIGWRKRVINIDWSATSIRKEITSDDVTKDDTKVHAWSYFKALEYLTELGREINNAFESGRP